MSIDPQLLVKQFPLIAGSIALLIVGKTVLVGGVGRLFGLSFINAIRAGLLLAPGGEFAFVAFGEAVQKVSLETSGDRYDLPKGYVNVWSKAYAFLEDFFR